MTLYSLNPIAIIKGRRKTGESTTYTMVDVVTKTKYDHKNQTPGVKVSYRILAKRGEKLSGHSNIATVYDE